MRIWNAVALIGAIALFTAAAHAQYTSPAVDFFMHDRFYDTFLRDHYRFEEPMPLRIEYWYVNWLDSGGGANEYKDHLHLEGLFPVYRGRKLIIDLPFQYFRLPIWAEIEEQAGTEIPSYGGYINVLHPNLMTRWTITDRLKSIIGWEYNLKGDGGEEGNFGKPSGRIVCLLKGFLSYDLHEQLNFAAGARFDRYYYDTREDPDISFKLADRLYCQPAIMLNWHPSDSFTLLLGIPGAGVHLELSRVLKAEARVSIDERGMGDFPHAEIAIRAKPLERTNLTLRFFNTPYMEIPIKGSSLQQLEASSTTPQAERLFYTDKSIILEIGRELNPAALVSLGFRYSPGGDVELKDRNYKNVTKLDTKPHFAVGATFTVDIEALAGVR